jgi:hypothetical protein
MAITKEIWQNHIEGNLFKDNQFLQCVFNADEYVLQGKVVHIPQAGGTPTVTKNRSELPASVTTRTDTDVTYALDEYTSDPVKISNAETVELSYDKRESVLNESEAALRETIADNILISWAPSGSPRINRTTGAAVAAHMDGATGYRKAFLPSDLKKAGKKLDKDGVSKEDRFCLMSADMHDQFTDALTETQYRDYSRAYDEKTGVLGKLYGFTIMNRASCLVYTGAATPVVKPYGAVGAEGDNDAVLCWQKNAIERAIGEIVAYENIGDPTYYGDIYSFLIRMGGRKRRDDQKGVMVIVQDTAAA